MQSMKVLAIITAGALCGALAEDAQVNPLSKVFELINSLKAQIHADGDQEGEAYDEYANWCRTTTASLQNDIKTSTSAANKLSAKVNELSSDIEVGDTKVDELSGATSKSQAELKEATGIRDEEAAEFAVGEKELADAVDTLERALSVLERQLSAGSSFAQIDTSNLSTLLSSLSVITDAAGFSASSKESLLALVQARDDEDDVGAPAAATYKKHDGGIMDALEDMKEKAEHQLSDLRKEESNRRHSFELFKQSLEDENAATTKELNDEKSGKAANSEEKASSEGNLELANRETKTSQKNLEQLQSQCQTVASDHEASVAARHEELKAIDEAEKILKETTGGAEEQSYDFLQVAAASSVSQRQRSRQLAKEHVISMVQHLAKVQHSTALAQLASRISAVLKYGNHGKSDPFGKVKDLISTMIAKLEKEGEAAATEKAYCDEEMAKTTAKKSELEDTVAKLTAKIEKAASASSSLKEEVSELQSELSVLVKEQAEMDEIRRKENAAYVVAKKDLEQGLGGVRKALTVLREFYAAPEKDEALLQTDDSEDGGQQMSSLMQQAARQPSPPEQFEVKTGAGTGIIGLLEVIESDFAKNLATEDAAESDASSAYEKQTQANKVTKAEKEQDQKFKTGEFKSLDKSIGELEADKVTEVSELSAVTEYDAKIKERCVAKPETYEVRKARREAEITGLKDALAALEGEALMQTGSQRRQRAHLRGDSLRTD